jgi:hypothetical protein
LDVLGIDVVSPFNWDLGRDTTVVWLITVGAAGEEKVTVNLLRVLLEALLQDAVCFVTLLSFKSVGDLAVVDSGHETIGDGSYCFVKVGLCGEDVDRHLRGDGDIVRGKGGKGGGVGDRVKRDG